VPNLFSQLQNHEDLVPHLIKVVIRVEKLIHRALALLALPELFREQADLRELVLLEVLDTRVDDYLLAGS
jgi:hypothetical protein